MSEDTRTLRAEVRDVIAGAELPSYAQCDAWMRGHDLDFTKALAMAGLIGLTWPSNLGGRGAGNVDRLVVTEELLRVGAPVAAHWIADRQIGPAILRHGSESLQQEFLPRIASGEVTFCLGMSETESGSDLAAVRTRAVPVDGGFRLTGRKIWTSHAHRSTHAYVLARTDTTGAKHEGLTELVVDMTSEGVDVRPIRDLAGEHHFNETIFEDVFVPEGHVIGQVGGGWAQVTEQLSFERGGMERLLSSYPLLAATLDPELDVSPDPASLGALIARLHVLRSLAHDVASRMDRGDAPIQKAALLKYLGTAFEVDVVEYFRESAAVPPVPGGGAAGLLAGGIAAAPGATLRGGATEVLLTIVGREVLAPRSAGNEPTVVGDPDLVELLGKVLHDHDRTTGDDGLPAVWATAVELGWTGIGVPEEAGGMGGELADLAAVVAGIARHGHSAPVAETALAARLLAAAGRRVDVGRPATVVLGDGVRASRTEAGWRLDGSATGVPWATVADRLVVVAATDHGDLLFDVPAGEAGLTVDPAANLAGEPRGTVGLDGVLVPEAVGSGEDVPVARRTAAALLVAATLGAAEAAAEAAREHVRVREQFGKPLAAFQAVAHHVARLTAEVETVRVALHSALEEEADKAGWRALAARITASRASTVIARVAHQLLGAMGVTEEHDLHRYTLRLWSWRDEQVSEGAATRRLGEAAAAAGEAGTWDWIVRETDVLTTGSAWEASR